MLLNASPPTRHTHTQTLLLKPSPTKLPDFVGVDQRSYGLSISKMVVHIVSIIQMFFFIFRIPCTSKNINGLTEDYLIRRNFGADKFPGLFIFAHLQILRFQKPDIRQFKRKTGAGFAKIYLGFIFMYKNVEIQYTYLRANSGFARKCAKIFTNKVVYSTGICCLV